MRNPQLWRKFCPFQMPEEILPRGIAHGLSSGWEEATGSSRGRRKQRRLGGEGVCVARVLEGPRLSRGVHLPLSRSMGQVALPAETCHVAECSLSPTFASLPALYKNTAAW